MIQPLHSRRSALVLGLLGLFIVSNGCESEPAAPVAEVQQKQKDDKEARLKAYGQGGAPSGKAKGSRTSK